MTMRIMSLVVTLSGLFILSPINSALVLLDE
jgi:hypothetical protein